MFRVGEGKQEHNRLYTAVYSDMKTNLTISKSKGFQLNKLPIDIFSWNHGLFEDAPKNPDLFGQHVVSSLCHEIFHNIAGVIRMESGTFRACLETAMSLAANEKNVSNKRKIITNFVDSLDEVDGITLDKSKRKKMVTQLTILSAVANNKEAVDVFDKASKNKKHSRNIDDEIKAYKKILSKQKRHEGNRAGYNILTITGIAASVIFGIAGGGAAGILLPLIGTAFGVGGNISSAVKDKKSLEATRSGARKNMEEYYCDLFAGMYNLPVAFRLIGAPRKYLPDQVDNAKLKQLNDLEREIMIYGRQTYPTMNERNYTAVKLAEKALSTNKELDPAFKKYLEWIVDNFSSTKNLDIDTIYNKATYDPTIADDLDKHLRDFATNNNITITEYDLSWMFNPEFCE